jgi:hypothetical protein
MLQFLLYWKYFSFHLELSKIFLEIFYVSMVIKINVAFSLDSRLIHECDFRLNQNLFCFCFQREQRYIISLAISNIHEQFQDNHFSFPLKFFNDFLP